MSGNAIDLEEDVQPMNLDTNVNAANGVLPVIERVLLSGCGKSGAWESPECAMELHWDTAESDFQDHGEYLQCRVRTWLQLMCCASVLELRVLISEWRT